jgi:casein kinase 1/casein kinase I family protein HRR25
MGVGKKQNLVHIIDLGLSKRYKCPKTGKHLEFIKKKNVIGTMRYASLNAHKGYS